MRRDGEVPVGVFVSISKFHRSVDTDLPQCWYSEIWERKISDIMRLIETRAVFSSKRSLKVRQLMIISMTLKFSIKLNAKFRRHGTAPTMFWGSYQILSREPLWAATRNRLIDNYCQQNTLQLWMRRNVASGRWHILIAFRTIMIWFTFHNFSWFQALAAVWMRTSLFWHVTQHRLVVTDVSGQPVGLIFKGSVQTLLTTNLCCLTSRKSEDLFHSAVSWVL